MIISDLQYFESAENSEVQGGYNTAFADGIGTAQAYGDKTSATTTTYGVADAVNGVSLAGSRSTASASYDPCKPACPPPSCNPCDPCKPKC